MIYKYCCTSCGERFDGEKIAFDLVEMLDMDMDSRIESLLNIDNFGKNDRKKISYEAIHAFITSKELKEIAEAGGTQLQHGVAATITISLRQFFSYMTVGIVVERGKFADLPKDDMTITHALGNALSVAENAGIVGTIAKKYWEVISESFHLKAAAKSALRNFDSETKSKVISEIENNTDNYEAIFQIKPLFFNNSDHLYTIQIRKDGNFINIMRDKGTFRGYCTNPECRKPVLLHTGKYPHRVVGMLGAMSAGKTSMITAMTVEIEEKYAVLGVRPVTGAEKLYDDDAENRDKDYELYQHDWAVGKTAGDMGKKTSYNVSFFLTDKSNLTNSVILTLADIAGEKCYDQKKKTIALDAFLKYPMIINCDAYLICACINQKSYGNQDGEEVTMPPDAIQAIASGIYNRYYQDGAERIPPLCIVMTKADKAKENTAAGGENNPFKNISPISKNEYLFNDGLNILTSIYNAEKDSNIRRALELCAETYNAMSSMTYTAILSAAAMGRDAVKFQGDSNEIGFNMPHSDLGPFRRTRLQDVWRWILKVCGVVPVFGNYKFEEVPSYLEYYSVDHSHVYHIDNWEKRLKAVGCIGINRANSDRMMYRASKEAITWWEKIKLQGEENARRAHILGVMPKDLSESIIINTKHD